MIKELLDCILPLGCHPSMPKAGIQGLLYGFLLTPCRNDRRFACRNDRHNETQFIPINHPISGELSLHRHHPPAKELDPDMILFRVVAHRLAVVVMLLETVSAHP
jgi:hypothetical protein